MTTGRPACLCGGPVCGRAVSGVLYGDNAMSRRPIGDLWGLEIFVCQAGIALENALRQRRLESMSAGDARRATVRHG